jgi:hypothetical protein
MGLFPSGKFILRFENRVGVYEIPINLRPEARLAGQVDESLLINLHILLQTIIQRLR